MRGAVLPTTADAGALSDHASKYLNRELSWLDFNGRVLAMAGDPSVPLLERVKFCAIFAGNLDEFYEVRVAGLKDQVAANVTQRSPDGLRPAAQLSLISEVVRELVQEHSQSFAKLVAFLAAERIEIVGWADLSEQDRFSLDGVFLDGIFPVLTPLAVDPGHPFPYISNLSLNLATLVRDPVTGERRFARVKVPPLLPRFVGLPDGHRWLPLEELIAAELALLFPGMVIEGAYAFRVTRNADLTVQEEDADDLLEAVETELRRRRFGKAVRLEVAADMPDHVVAVLIDELELEADDLLRVDGPLDLTGLWSLIGLDRPDLKDEPWVPRTQVRLQEDPDAPLDLFGVIRAGDLLVHHPYDSFTTSVERFIQHAATDPDVLTIKLTLYRTSGGSPVVTALIDAAERGKQVAALVELKARFDEQANIAWARKLEEAGVHVVYGLVGLKTHTKVSLVVRAEADGLRRYAHVATGNYNSTTARIYEDIGLFSASPELGQDLTKLFNGLTGYSRPLDYQKLIVAPNGLRERVLELIRNEMPTSARPAGAIVMKMNSLVDQAVIDALYEASQAGVRVDLIIRGICCVRPGVVGLSENIRTRSVVGRFLEHSRVWRFANGDGDGKPAYFIGSADIMPRNLDRRIEAVMPIEDPRLRLQLDDMIAVLLADNVLAWTLDEAGRWSRCTVAPGDDAVNAHELFGQRAIARSLHDADQPVRTAPSRAETVTSDPVDGLRTPVPVDSP